MATQTLAIPPEILTQHVAVLGKTGSGKTSTAKLLIEQVVAQGARVCILDPIKSDWWGLTSSADGTKAGLPFHILGGPRGHVPLHASAGKVIGEIVANASLPLSIIDMADFEPGGQAKFFVDFAPTLLRKMRGVVYLVIEEAHLFAPKERSGIGAENLSIHWAKTLATAGRSKGIRLILVTQRTQALHNALLGSCDTMLAHRLTAPADQEPVIKWLKANTSKAVLEQVTGSLASLKTGDAWLCSGEAKRFEVVHFPRIQTYDNTATPTGDGDTREITMAAVDQTRLRAIIGDAVEQAKADDPKELRRQLEHASRQIAASAKRISELEARAERTSGFVPRNEGKPAPVLTDADRTLITKLAAELEAHAARLITKEMDVRAMLRAEVDEAVEQAGQRVEVMLLHGRKDFQERLEKAGFAKVLAKLEQVAAAPAGGATMPPRGGKAAPHLPPAPLSALPGQKYSKIIPPPPVDPAMTPSLRGILVVLANSPDGCQIGRLALLSGKRISGGFRNLLAALRSHGWMEGANTATMQITDAGRDALGAYDPLPTGDALGHYWLNNPMLSPAARQLLGVLLEHGAGMRIGDLAAAVNKQVSGGFRNLLAELRTAGVIVGKNTEVMQAHKELFS